MRVGILTGGGDAPGLNGIIESVTRALLSQGITVLGIEDGFEGFILGRHRELSLQDIQGCHQFAGTILGTSNKFGLRGHEQEFIKKYHDYKLDGIVVAGGDGTFANLKGLQDQVKIVGLPKTIDNDISGTEVSFGYDTACSVVANSVDALRATADAHRRVIIVETMGRTAGWIALGGGLAGYADAILIPEISFDIKDLIAHIKNKLTQRRGLVLVVAEGATPQGEMPIVAHHVVGSPQTERYGGIAEKLAREIEAEIGHEARHVVLGHLQRAEHPTATDRLLTLGMGVAAAHEVLNQRWGQAIVYRSGRVCVSPLQDLMGPPRLVDPEHHWVKWARSLDIFI
jgi:6-phosphofructokinase 1